MGQVIENIAPPCSAVHFIEHSTEIQPSNGWKAIDLKELWAYRELLYFLIWRDLKARYKQTVFGAAWAIVQPLFAMIIFTLFFGRVVKVSSNGIPYSIFAYAGLLPWTYFTNAVSQGSNSLIGSSHLITKVYFPRLIIPGAAVIGGLVDSGIAFAVLLPLMFYHRLFPPIIGFFTVLLFYLLTTGLALGVSLWLTALNVRYRDIRNAVPVLLQLWMFATPVVYPLDLVPARYRWVVALNPMAGIVEAFRSVLVSRPIDLQALFPSVLFTAMLIVTGLFYFRRVERTFADLV
jgi:lipopolysaccharide transport system permease protein